MFRGRVGLEVGSRLHCGGGLGFGLGVFAKEWKMNGSECQVLTKGGESKARVCNEEG